MSSQPPLREIDYSKVRDIGTPHVDGTPHSYCIQVLTIPSTGGHTYRYRFSSRDEFDKEWAHLTSSIMALTTSKRGTKW